MKYMFFINYANNVCYNIVCMKKVGRKDKINLIILTITFVLVILFILRNRTLYGSVLDWNNQHSVIPEYFRTLFYNTQKLFPNFALNLGAGQNIYNYAYYGLLSPVTLISYLFPFISMKTFIQISSVLIVYISILLFYYFLRLNKYKENISLISTFAFFAAVPLLFHSHRHIMFISYMPFLILALIGVKKYLENNNKKILCVSVLLIILTSYYYSIPSIICIIIYWIYNYIKLNKKMMFKDFIKDGFKFLIPIFTAILIASILLIPTFLSLLGGRSETNTIIKLSDLLIPKINIQYFMYDKYGIGLTAFSLIGILSLLLSKKNEDKFLAMILSIIVLFPIVNYILNATMYIDAKVLIPFLPLYIICEAKLFNKIYENKIENKKIIIGSIVVILWVFLFKSENNYIFYIDYIISLVLIILFSNFNKKRIFDYIVIISFIAIALYSSTRDNYVKYKRVYNQSNFNQKELGKLIPNDFNHTTLYNNDHDNVNTINENINIYSDYIYSSIENTLYNKFYYDIFENNMPYRNRALLTATSNIMYLMFSNNKYFISDDIDIVGYKEIDSIGKTKLYENNDVLPFMYVSYNFMGNSEFDNYGFPYNNEILLNNTIINSDIISNYETNIKEISADSFSISKKSENININNDVVNVSKNNSEIVMNIDDYYKDKILFISFNVVPQSCDDGDLSIEINNVINKLTCKEWKYYNQNETFNYVLSESYKDNLVLIFNKGNYIIRDLKLYYMDYNDIKEVNKKVTKVNIDKIVNQEKIYASVNALEDGYYVTTLPYDKGFTIKIDNKEVEYEIVNKAFVGFKINKGYHNIEISYTSPGKYIGYIFSIIGVIIYLICIRKNGSTCKYSSKKIL